MYKTITTNIMVNNVKETLEFYETQLGFSTIVSVPNENGELNFAIVQKDEISIMFQFKDSIIEEYPTLACDTIHPAFTLFITVDNVKDMYETLKEKVVFAKELHSTFYKKDEFSIFDNNQNILTISSNE